MVWIQAYVHSHYTNVDFFVDLRRTQLNCSETYQIIAGDLNTTLDPQWDRIGYVRNDHWRSREIINDWAEDEDGNCMVDAFRHPLYKKNSPGGTKTSNNRLAWTIF